MDCFQLGAKEGFGEGDGVGRILILHHLRSVLQMYCKCVSSVMPSSGSCGLMHLLLMLAFTCSFF